MKPHALTTGAAGGLGQALAGKLKAADWSLALAGRRYDALARLAQDLDALAIEADVSTPEGARSALAACLTEFGAPPSGLAQCAGNSLIPPCIGRRLSNTGIV